MEIVAQPFSGPLREKVHQLTIIINTEFPVKEDP